MPLRILGRAHLEEYGVKGCARVQIKQVVRVRPARRVRKGAIFEDALA